MIPHFRHSIAFPIMVVSPRRSFTSTSIPLTTLRRNALPNRFLPRRVKLNLEVIRDTLRIKDATAVLSYLREAGATTVGGLLELAKDDEWLRSAEGGKHAWEIRGFGESTSMAPRRHAADTSRIAFPAAAYEAFGRCLAHSRLVCSTAHIQM